VCVCVCVCVCVDDQQSFIAISQQVNTRAWFRLNLHTHNQPVWWNIWRKTVCVCVCVCVSIFWQSSKWTTNHRRENIYLLFWLICSMSCSFQWRNRSDIITWLLLVITWLLPYGYYLWLLQWVNIHTWSQWPLLFFCVQLQLCLILQNKSLGN